MALTTHSFPKDLSTQDTEYRSLIIKVKKYKQNTYKDMYDESYKAFADAKNDALSTLQSLASGDKNENPAADIKGALEKVKSANSEKKDDMFLYAVSLPFPNEFSDSQSHGWEKDKSILGDIMTGIQDSAPDLRVVKLSPGKLISSLANAYGVRKPVANPGYYQNYSGSEPRKFRLTWVFIPNDKEEASELFTIIYNLKKYTLPTAANGGDSKLVLLAPFIFDITTKSNVVNVLTRMNDLVCTDFEIMYPGKAQFYPDGSPKYLQLTMSFSENSMLYSNNY